jgi:hypothetical protein
MSTWLPFAIKIPGPGWKQGYGDVAERELSFIEGEVKHSAEGSMGALLGEIQHPTRQASWHFSIDKDGTIVQHYPLEAITWHCGLPGDRSFDTSIVGNITLVGEEHAGVRGETIVGAQQAASRMITDAIHDLCPRVASRGLRLRDTLWEHNWVSPVTSCPSGRMDWAAFIGMEDEMTPAQEAKLDRVLALADALLTPKQYGPEWYNRMDTPLHMIETVLSYLDGVHLGRVYKSLGIDPLKPDTSPTLRKIIQEEIVRTRLTQ